MIIVGSHLIVANEINDLTGFCIPDFEARGGQVCVRYDLGCAVIEGSPYPLEALISGLTGDRSLALPRITPPKHTLDCFIEDGRASSWLINTMRDDMARLTMAASTALDLIENRDKRFLKYLRVYSEGWLDTNIQSPLRRLAS